MDKINYNLLWRGVRACFAYLLAALVVLLQVNITAFAIEEIEYFKDGALYSKQAGDVTTITESTTAWGDGSPGEKWYVTKGNVTIEGRVNVSGTVHLILKDESKLTIKEGIELTGNSTYLTIYGQINGTGQLISTTVVNSKAGIGVSTGKSLTIYGGKVVAKGGEYAAGIGGYNSNGGTIMIYGGNIAATGGERAAGIGGGANGNGGTITIQGGNITAKGGKYAAGIGGGVYRNAGTIRIQGGNITATGGESGSGIGSGSDSANPGTITIQGGNITAVGGRSAAGIGGRKFTTGTNGSAVIYASSISDQSNERNWSGVIFEGNNGKVYGTQVTPNTDFEIPSDKTLEIETGKELVIDNGRTLTNNGTITNNGTLTNNGKIIQNGTITGSSPAGDGLIGVPPKITLNPHSQTVTAGGSVSFTVRATGTPAPTYQWQVKTESDDWQDIDGARSDTYSITPVNFAMKGNKYRCKVTNDIGTATSSEATLTVNKIQLPTPTATIDYVNEKLTGLTANVGYKIKVDNGNEQEITANVDGKISIEAGWFGTELSIKQKASDDNHIDSEEQKIGISARPAAPDGLQGENETFDGQNDGKITGTTSQMEYKLANGNGWTPCSGNGTSPLAPGTYQVRIAATGSNFASLHVRIVIATGEARTYTLNVTAPTFDAVEYGYTQPAAKPITIQNTGNTTSNITKVELNSTESFDIAGSGDSVNPGSNITTYTIQPKEGLAVGTHTANITVEYTNSGIATAQVSFAVGKATQTPPVKPELDTKTHNSVTLKVISANSNTAVVEYSKDGGNSYQESNTFTGLNPSTTYNFVARYKETENYKASEKSAVTEITTDNAPASGGGYISGSVGDSSGGSSDSSGTKSNNDKQNIENTGLLPLKVDANGNATITKDIILKAIKKAKAEAKNGKETIAKISIETGAAPKSIKISIKSDALKELISSNIHRFVIDTDRLIDLGFNAKTLKKLKNKTKGDVIFSISKTKVTSSGAKKAIGKRPVYDISIAYSKNGQETKIENLNDKTVSIAIPYKAAKKERSSNLYAVYVDKQGKVKWLTKSSYDKDKKAVIFETAHFSIYGVGYKKDITKFKDIT